MQESVYRAAVIDPPCQVCGRAPSTGRRCAGCARAKRREVLLAAVVTLAVQGVLFVAILNAGGMMTDPAYQGVGVAPLVVAVALRRIRPSVALGIACGAVGGFVGSYALPILWFLWQLVTGQVC